MLDSKVARGLSAGTFASFLIFSIQYFDIPHKEYWVAVTPVLLSMLLAGISFIDAKLGVKSELQHRLETRLEFLSNGLNDPFLDPVTKQEYAFEYQETHKAMNVVLSDKIVSARRVQS